MNTTELRKRFEDNFISHPHEDDDYGICASHISVCSKCKKEFYYLNLEKCKCKAPCVPKPCTCGADKIKEEQFEFLQLEIEAAEKAKEEQSKEATVKFFKEQKEIAQIRGDAFWVHEFDLQIFGQPLNGCSLFLKNPEQ